MAGRNPGRIFRLGLALVCAVLLAAAVWSSLAPAGRGLAQYFSNELGPEIGTGVPHSLALNDQDGVRRGGVDDLTGEAGLVLLFNRSLDWCPFCQAQIIEINGRADEIRARGYEIAVVTYDPPETLERFDTERDITLTLLSDPQSEAIDAFGLRNEEYRDDPRRYGVPHPVIFLVSPGGVIRAKLYEEDFRVRPPVDSLLAAIDGLG